MEKSYKPQPFTFSKYIRIYHTLLIIFVGLPIFSSHEKLIIAIAGISVLWIFYFLTPLKYSFGRLYINSKAIYKPGIMGYISYSKANVVVCYTLKSLFFVFSEEVLEGKSKKELFRLCKQHKAILFPWHPQIEKDFPQLFQKDNK